MKKLITFMLAICLVISIIPTVSASATDRNTVEQDVVDALKANAWTKNPSRKSKKLTLGYALAKIKEVVELDPNAYVFDDGERIEDALKGQKIKAKYEAPSKTQRKALKWARNTGILSYQNTRTTGSYQEYIEKGGYREVYDGTVVLSRSQLVELMSVVLSKAYSARTPDIRTRCISTVLNYKNGPTNERSITTGMIIFNGSQVDLSKTATRKDLALALKNLSVLSENTIAKIVYRDKALKSYSYDDAVKDLKEIASYAKKELGIKEVETKKKVDFYILELYGARTNNGSGRDIDLGSGITFNTYDGIYEGTLMYYRNKDQINLDPKIIDIVKTYKNILQDRG